MKKVIFLIFILLSLNAISQEKKFITYQVKSGETLKSISDKLSITTEELLTLNPDIEKGDLSGVKVLVIPNKDYSKQRDITNYETRMVGGKDIIVDGYVYHEVLPKENIFRISQRFKVESSTLKQHNRFLLFDGLKVGQILKIPLPESRVTVDETTMLPYVVKPKETKYSIANQHGISIDSLESLNPEIKNGLKIDQVIFVPKGNLMSKSNLKVHTVQKEETLYSISKQYGISQEELISLNPELEIGLKAGMLIKIPRNKDMIFEDEIGENRSFKVAMLLPFLSENDTLGSKEIRIQNIATDFYFGALIALDSLKKQGVSVDMQVLDTKKSEFVSKRISRDGSLNEKDLIIGPLFLDNIKTVARNLSGNDVMVVSPISEQDHSYIQYRNLVQDTPTDDQLSFEMLKYIRENYSGENLILITDDKQGAKFKSVVKEIESIRSVKKPVIIKPDKGYIKPDVFKSRLDTLSKNWVLLLGEDDVLIADVIQNLGVQPEKFELTLFALDKPRNFEKMDNNFLSRVHLHYPSSSFTDYNSAGIRRFIHVYSERFGGFPSTYAIKGFDVTYDILMRLSQGKELTEQGVSQRLKTRYKFIENTSGNPVNQGVFLLKYEDLELKIVK